MKKSILLVSIIAAAIFVLFWTRFRSGEPNIPRTDVRGNEHSNSQTSPATSTKRDLRPQLHEIATNANQPISFFGKVVDQYNMPVVAAKVTFQIRYMKEIGMAGIGDTFSEPATLTGSDGRFSITDAKGSLMTIKALEKVGYEPAPSVFAGTYWYWRDTDPYRPDPENPVVLRMWKRGPSEKLTEQRVRTAIPYDGTPVTYDLLTGHETATGGDLRVTLLRSPLQITYGQRNYEWTLTLEAVGGGLIESTDEQMYRAPSDGYQPRITIHMPADAPKWSDMRTVRLYLKSRGGRNYGRVELNVMVGSDRKETGFTYHSFINPNGSQNLEYDPLQNVIRSTP